MDDIINKRRQTKKLSIINPQQLTRLRSKFSSNRINGRSFCNKYYN
jgi:hypothetical protein